MKKEKTELVGFIYRHKEDDYSIHLVEVEETDQEVILGVLSDYDTKGFSVRGSKEAILCAFS